ncbi:unnamed protein product [Cunninghamella echinulata]
MTTFIHHSQHYHNPEYNYQHHHPPHRRRRLSSISTTHVTPSTIECTEFYISSPSPPPSPQISIKKSISPSLSSSSISSMEQLHRQFKAQQIILLKRSSIVSPCLNQTLANNLKSWLPSRIAASSKWHLLYSLEQHGSSIKTLYHRIKSDPSTSANLIVIRTADDELMGAYLSEPLKNESTYYGSGECFLWKSIDNHHTEVYSWTNRNDYFIYSNHSFIAIGGGDGHIGLFLYGDLHHGHTQPCATFNNELLTMNNSFECIGLEVWGFHY